MDPVYGAVVGGLFLVVATMLPYVFVQGRRLSHIGHAVNGAEPGEPTLRQVTVDASAMLVAVAEAIGVVKEDIVGVKEAQSRQGDLLAAHITQDVEIQQELRDGVADLHAGQEAILAHVSTDEVPSAP